MIDMKTKYKTRSGRPVRIYALDGRNVGEIHGAILDDFGWGVAIWTEAGLIIADQKHSYDLIEVRTAEDVVLAEVEKVECATNATLSADICQALRDAGKIVEGE